MPLNDCRDEAGRFLDAIRASNEPVDVTIGMLQQELDILKNIPAEDGKAIGHQVYDMLFLLFEIASRYRTDLDSEWAAGRERKAKKYL